MDHPALLRILADLAKAGVIPEASPGLKARMPEVGAALRQAVLAEVPAFSNSRNPDILPGLDQHAREHMGEILRLFSGGEIGDFAFVKAHAQRRAEQHFPLEAILHAYRCGHRSFSHWLREDIVALVSVDAEQVISAVADFSIEYTNLVSSIAAAAYVDHTRMLAEAEGDRRIELMSILLSGYDEADGRVAQILKRAGYLEQRLSYCVAVVQAVNAAEMENPARAQRISNAIAEAMAGTSIRRLSGLYNNLVTMVFSDLRRASGWTAPQSSLAERIYQQLLQLGPAVVVGISADHPSTSFLPKALHEANLALDLASAAQRVVQFTHVPIRSLLVHRGNEFVQSAAPAWLPSFMTANEKSQGTLVTTLRAVAAADMNVQKAARQSGSHPNTVYARIEKIREITGHDAQRYLGLTELLLRSPCPSRRRYRSP